MKSFDVKYRDDTDDEISETNSQQSSQLQLHCNLSPFSLTFIYERM